MRMARHRLIRGLLFHGFVIALGIAMVYPVLWMISGSFKANTEIFSSASLIPRQFLFENYARGWKFVGMTTFTTFFRNSLFYVILATFGTVISSALVAYGFGRIKFPGKDFWFVCMLMTLMLPVQVVMIPQFILFFKLEWTN